jgi:mitochondrial fission protein ELM1
MTETPEIWAVADARRGVENQAIGLAEALAAECGGRMDRVLIRDDGYVTLPDAANPTVWIGCGRPAIALARRHRKSFANARFVYVQDPRGQYGLFDAIVAPEHDRLKRPNAIAMLGSPNRMSEARLADAASQFASRIGEMRGPRAAILLGGPNKRLRMTDTVIGAIVDRVHWLRREGYALMLTASRRTPRALTDKLRALATEDRDIWLFDGVGDNPYFAFLEAADLIFVTEDSTNMLTEAAFTGKPIYSLPLEGNPGKFRLLHAGLEARNVLRPFLGRIDDWKPSRLDETWRIARLLNNRFFPV